MDLDNFRASVLVTRALPFERECAPHLSLLGQSVSHRLPVYQLCLLSECVRSLSLLYLGMRSPCELRQDLADTPLVHADHRALLSILDAPTQLQLDQHADELTGFQVGPLAFYRCSGQLRAQQHT